MTYKIVKIASFYKAFLSYYYSKYPEITKEWYQVQYDHLMSQGHAWSNYFQQHFSEMGVEAHEIVYNAYPLQEAWAKEHGIINFDILFEQLKTIQPDVIFFQDCLNFEGSYFKKLRQEIPSVKLIIGHCCTPFTKDNLKSFTELDFMLACSPGFLEIFKRNNIKAHEFLHAFEASTLKKIEQNNFPNTDVLFSGSFLKTSVKGFHDERLNLVESIIREDVPITIYGNIDQESNLTTMAKQLGYVIALSLKKTGLGFLNQRVVTLNKLAHMTEFPRRNRYSKEFLEHTKPPLFGFDMLKAIAHSKISLNSHGGVAGDYAANVRMFEVTGVGSLLLTDHKKNIGDIFVPDSEIVTYKSVGECIDKIKWLLKNPSEISKIAQAGQRRTLKDHSIENRVHLLNSLITEELSKK